jgi:hypothetical protein
VRFVTHVWPKFVENIMPAEIPVRSGDAPSLPPSIDEAPYQKLRGTACVQPAPEFVEVYIPACCQKTARCVPSAEDVAPLAVVSKWPKLGDQDWPPFVDLSIRYGALWQQIRSIASAEHAMVSPSSTNCVQVAIGGKYCVIGRPALGVRYRNPGGSRVGGNVPVKVRRE